MFVCSLVFGLHVCFFVFVYPPLILLLFLFWSSFTVYVGKMDGCGKIVAYYVKCTNVLKKWYGSDCVNQGFKGAEGDVSNSDV